MILGLTKMLEHIRHHAKFFRVMLGKNGDPAFADKIRQYVQKRIRRVLSDALLSDENLADLYLGYVSSGAIGVLSWWLEHDMPYPPEQLASISHHFIVAGLATLKPATS